MDRNKFAVNVLALSPDGLIMYIPVEAILQLSCGRSTKMVDRVNISVNGELKGHRQAVLCLATVYDKASSFHSGYGRPYNSTEVY